MSQQLELLTENSSKWSSISLITPEIQKKEIKPFVLLALKELEGTPDSRTSSLMNAAKFAAVREVVRHFARLRSGTRYPWRAEDVGMFLESLRFAPECVSELTSIVCVDKIYEQIPTHVRMKPGLESLQWRIDISLYQNNMKSNPESQSPKEIMRRNTFIILTLKLTDGNLHTYRLSVEKFHELRFTIASVLKNMIVLERRKCMRKD